MVLKGGFLGCTASANFGSFWRLSIRMGFMSRVCGLLDDNVDQLWAWKWGGVHGSQKHEQLCHVGMGKSSRQYSDSLAMAQPRFLNPEEYNNEISPMIHCYVCRSEYCSTFIREGSAYSLWLLNTQMDSVKITRDWHFQP